ncbi:hypothetical protein AAOE16_03110 [Ekhidna sp. MALMAid0563]|uniref:hypothetical protein n=1 Tax=Ekhidna sp. MALMAid0563 TaxID=3143937 RepID=UPI0032DFE7BB
MSDYTREIHMSLVKLKTLVLALKHAHEDHVKSGYSTNNDFIYYAMSLVDWYLNEYDQLGAENRIASFQELKQLSPHHFSWLERDGDLITQEYLRKEGKGYE